MMCQAAVEPMIYVTKASHLSCVYNLRAYVTTHTDEGESRLCMIRCLCALKCKCEQWRRQDLEVGALLSAVGPQMTSRGKAPGGRSGGAEGNL